MHITAKHFDQLEVNVYCLYSRPAEVDQEEVLDQCRADIAEPYYSAVVLSMNGQQKPDVEQTQRSDHVDDHLAYYILPQVPKAVMSCTIVYANPTTYTLP